MYGASVYTLTAQGSVGFPTGTNNPSGGMLISMHVANTSAATWAATVYNVTGTTTATSTPIVGFLSCVANSQDRRNFGAGVPVAGLYVVMSGNANLDFEVAP